MIRSTLNPHSTSEHMRTTISVRTTMAFVGLLLLAGSTAQPAMHVGLYPNAQGTTDVRLTPDGDFDGLLSSLVLTIGCGQAGGDHAMDIHQTPEMTDILRLAVSGTDHTVGAETYRIFSGIGLNSLASLGKRWYGGMSVTIATLGNAGGPALRIVDDEWAKDRRNNGGYYVSLNGIDRTGRVMSAIGTNDEATGPSITVLPNPWTHGPLTLEINGAEAGDAGCDLVDASGKTVLTREFELQGSVYRMSIQPGSPLQAGAYRVVVRTKSGTRSVPLVVASDGH